tara:strand:+ start:1361 stop:2827 length:1467 start_codon:yes stop_codon:yes gene_type:complete
MSSTIPEPPPKAAPPIIPASQTQPASSSIPDFIQLDQIPANYSQNIETDLLEPVVFQQGTSTVDGFTRFTLQNKGFLHSHSKIFVGLKPLTGGTEYFLSPHVGIGQIVKKAVLKVGNKTINEVDSWNQLHAVKSSLITNENNKEREQYLTGRTMNHGFVYDKASRTIAPTYGLDNSLETTYNTGTPADSDVLVPDWAVMKGSEQAECPTYSIDLSDLFPFLKTHQLPLYLFKEQISVEITFVPTTKQRAQLITGTADAIVEIDRNELKFCADYIWYGTGDEMMQYAKSNNDMSFSFVDYRAIEATTSAASLGSGIVRNLGMANRLVPRLITMVSDDSHVEASIISGINSIAPSRNASGISGAIKYNVRYNDRYEFTSDIDNSARLFSMTTHSEGVPPFVSRQEFSRQSAAGGLTVQKYAGRTQTELEGKFFYLSTRLTNGRVGQRGIEVHLSGGFPSSGSNVPNMLRCFAEYIRVARLSDGYLDVYNA